MNLPPRLRKLALVIHIAVSVGWLGAIITYLALGITTVTSRDPELIRSAWISMALIAGSVIIPLNLFANMTGLLMALATHWGLFRHKWVLMTFILSIAVTIFWLQHMPEVNALEHLALVTDDANLIGGFGGDLFYAGTTLGILLLLTGITVVKPRGTISWRKEKNKVLVAQAREE